ncbi:hypothetical protein Droror1_Dr00006350 [Drosera rotundifolia]
MVAAMATYGGYYGEPMADHLAIAIRWDVKNVSLQGDRNRFKPPFRYKLPWDKDSECRMVDKEVWGSKAYQSVGGDVVEKIRQHAQKFSQKFRLGLISSKKVAVNGVEHKKIRWLSPPMGMMKINVDVSMKLQKTISMGLIIRDAQGEVRLTTGRNISSSLNPTIGKALAIHMGLKQALQEGMSRVILESDTRTAMHLIKSGAADLSDVEMSSRIACG